MYYLLGSIIINPGSEQAYMNELLPSVERTVKESGGRYLAASSDIHSLIRPSVATRLVIIEWPSRDSVQAWWDSHGRQLIEGAVQLAEFHIVGIEGVSEAVAEHTHTEECQTEQPTEEAKEPAPTEASTAQQADTVAAE